MSRTLIIVGLAIAAVGLIWPWVTKLGLGRLPGDIYIQRDNFTFYAPITTGILISVVLSLILWLLSR
jgi:Protein of unknown function (DUF2905)